MHQDVQRMPPVHRQVLKAADGIVGVDVRIVVEEHGGQDLILKIALGGQDCAAPVGQDQNVRVTITAHARLTFQDVETNVSAFRISMGFLAVLLGLTVWALLMVVASTAEDR